MFRVVVDRCVFLKREDMEFKAVVILQVHASLAIATDDFMKLEVTESQKLKPNPK